VGAPTVQHEEYCQPRPPSCRQLAPSSQIRNETITTPAAPLPKLATTFFRCHHPRGTVAARLVLIVGGMRLGQGKTGSSPPRRIVSWQALACTLVHSSSGSISFAVRHGPSRACCWQERKALTEGMFTQKNDARMLQTKAPVVLQLVHQDRATQVAPLSGSPL
jgi:hypothetical protein